MNTFSNAIARWLYTALRLDEPQLPRALSMEAMPVIDLIAGAQDAYPIIVQELTQIPGAGGVLDEQIMSNTREGHNLWLLALSLETPFAAEEACLTLISAQDVTNARVRLCRLLTSAGVVHSWKELAGTLDSVVCIPPQHALHFETLTAVGAGEWVRYSLMYQWLPIGARPSSR